MKVLLFLSVLLFIPGNTGSVTDTGSISSGSGEPTPATNDGTTNTTPELPSTKSTDTTSTTRPTPITTTTTPTPPKSTTPTSIFPFYKQECRPLLMVSGILIIICTIFLISILMLLYKVCQLSRRLKTLSNSDLINMSESWMGTAESNKNEPEKEARESTVLMADSSQTQDETNNGAIKEDGEKVKGGEPAAEEKEVGGTASSEEASATPVAVAQSSASSKPEEEASKAEEEASSEAKEEADVEKK